MITSAQNSRLKLVRSLLGHPKGRTKEQALVVEGVRLLEEAHAAGWTFRFALFSRALSERGKTLLTRIQADDIHTDEVMEELLDSISPTRTSQGLLAVVEKRTLPYPDDAEMILILDGLQDPGNLGSLLRSASAAGFHAVFVTPGSTDAFASKVLRAGMGAHFHLPIAYQDWKSIQGVLSEFRFVLAEMEGETSLWQADLKGKLAIIIGGEAQGADKQNLPDEYLSVRIPMQVGTESLNAAAAGAVLLFEARRQRES